MVHHDGELLLAAIGQRHFKALRYRHAAAVAGAKGIVLGRVGHGRLANGRDLVLAVDDGHHDGIATGRGHLLVCPCAVRPGHVGKGVAAVLFIQSRGQGYQGAVVSKAVVLHFHQTVHISLQAQQVGHDFVGLARQLGLVVGAAPFVLVTQRSFELGFAKGAEVVKHIGRCHFDRGIAHRFLQDFCRGAFFARKHYGHQGLHAVAGLVDARIFVHKLVQDAFHHRRRIASA